MNTRMCYFTIVTQMNNNNNNNNCDENTEKCSERVIFRNGADTTASPAERRGSRTVHRNILYETSNILWNSL